MPKKIQENLRGQRKGQTNHAALQTACDANIIKHKALANRGSQETQNRIKPTKYNPNKSCSGSNMSEIQPPEHCASHHRTRSCPQWCFMALLFRNQGFLPTPQLNASLTLKDTSSSINKKNMISSDLPSLGIEELPDSSY